MKLEQIGFPANETVDRDAGNVFEKVFIEIDGGRKKFFSKM